jgi:hypothetical protein
MIQKLSADNQHVQQQQVTLELEFVYRLQCPSCSSPAAKETACLSLDLRMAKLYDLYMLVGDTGYRTEPGNSLHIVS